MNTIEIVHDFVPMSHLLEIEGLLKMDDRIRESDLLAMRFEKIETDNPLLGGYYFRNPKFRVKIDAHARLFVARPRWEGVESFWKEIPYNGKVELIQFIREWIQD